MGGSTDVGLINQFLARIFGAIDNGFGLIAGDVNHLFNMLIILNLVLAGLWWAYGARDAVEGLLRRVLMIGFFAFVLNNWAALSNIIFQSFALLGLKASGDRLSLAEFMNPGTVAHLGVQLVQQFGEKIGELSIWDAFFMTVLLTLAAVIVLAAFFVIAIQIFVALVVFKISTLAAFTLIPFAIFSKTSFIAERPLGYIVSAGVRLFIIAALVSISYDLFSAIQLTGLSLEQTAGITLGAVALAVLSFVAPRIAGDIISGGPSLGGGTALAGVTAGAMMGGAGLSALRGAAGAVLGSRGSGAVAAAAMALPAPGSEASAVMSSGALIGSGSRAEASVARPNRSIVAASSPIPSSGSTIGGTATPSTASESTASSPVVGPGPAEAGTGPGLQVSGVSRSSSATGANAEHGAGVGQGSVGSGWLRAGWQAATQPAGPVANGSSPPEALHQAGRSSGTSSTAPAAPAAPGASAPGGDGAGAGSVGVSELQTPQAPTSSAAGEGAPPLSIGPAPQPQDQSGAPWRPTLMEQLNQVRLATPDGDGGAGIGVPIPHPKDD
ncbi:MAG: P-type conjugative transfer protein TrbL [Rhodospirillales bacterium]|nr:P-type conjugative transfer protein TrbL [Rhodospirillales bacterium]